MTRKKGFIIKVSAFIPLDPKDFKAQAAAFGTVAAINETHKLPDDFFKTATVIGVEAKQGSYEAPAATGTQADPAGTPLTTDPLGDGVTVIDSMAALDDSVFQNIALADGTRATRRISVAQYNAENPDKPLTTTEPPTTATGRKKK